MSVLRRLLLVLAVTTSLLGLTGSARADDLPPSGSVAFATRLTLAAGRGTLTVQVRVGLRVTGFEFYVDTAPDPGLTDLAGPAELPVPGLDAVCRLQYHSSDNLSYACSDGGGWDDPTFLPPGTYRVAVPITYSGAMTRPLPDAGFATVRVYDPEYDFSFWDSWDSFPVVGPDHFSSTAEVLTAPTALDPATPAYDVDTVLAVAYDLRPGETATELEADLPEGRWRITGSNAARLGQQCFVRQDQRRLHCRAAPGQPAGLRTGRRELVVDLHGVADDPGDGYNPLTDPEAVDLTVDGVRDEVDQYALAWR